ncbi:Foie gras liver health family 1 [Trinorchestia longiramus]|nr:Foie gras liver health family 1 [Trinorchestia longiramus]
MEVKEEDHYGIPKDTLAQCSSLIFLLGLEPTANANHAIIWEVLSKHSKPTLQTPATFKLTSLDELSLPPMKPRRQSYEWYTPKGVLKSNWMSKYLYKVPALVAIFFSLDWSDSNWLIRKNELASIVSSVKEVIGDRSCRVAVILLQSSTGSPATDSSSPYTPFSESEANASLSGERASILCESCDLPTKHLFVLPLSDAQLIPGYTTRLEAALSDIAGGFYLSESKTVRGHRDFLNKTNHQLLFVRHCYKTGFLLEMKGDLQGAIKCYQQSYQHLSELRFTDTNLHEIRVSAAIISYKVCRVNFLLNLPRDAIAQFRRHIDLFRPRMGPKPLLFEHYAWLASQYELFGYLFENAVCRVNFLLNLPRDAIAQFRRHIDLFRPRMGPKPLLFEHYAWLASQYELFGYLFENAVLQGLPAVQTQHPGFYYQQAAQFASLRRTTALHLCSGATGNHQHLLDGLESLEIYGQRPWRAGKHSLEPPESEREACGIEAVQYHELTKVRHHDMIIPLYSQAVAQFQRYRCPRIKQQLMVQMATEYQKAAQHQKALAVVQHVLHQYRTEHWWPLVTHCSLLALQCAAAVADVPAYLAAALEITGPKVTLARTLKLRVFSDGLCNVLKGVPPASTVDTAAATPAWSSALQQCLSPVEVDMNALVACLEVRATFDTSTAPAFSKCRVSVHVRNNFLEQIRIRDITAVLEPNASGKQQQQQQEQQSQSPSQVVLRKDGYTDLPSGTVQEIVLPFTPQFLPAPHDGFKIGCVECSLDGSAAGGGVQTRGLVALLRWSGAGDGGVAALAATTPQHPEFFVLRSPSFDTLVPRPHLKVVSPAPLLDVQVRHDARALVWEWLEAEVVITSREEQPVTDLKLSLALQQPAPPALEQTSEAFCLPREAKVEQTSEAFCLPREAKVEQTSEAFCLPREAKVEQTSEAFCLPREAKVEQTSEAFCHPCEAKVEQTTHISNSTSAAPSESCGASVQGAVVASSLQPGAVVQHRVLIRSLTSATRTFTLTRAGKGRSSYCGFDRRLHSILPERMSVAEIRVYDWVIYLAHISNSTSAAPSESCGASVQGAVVASSLQPGAVVQHRVLIRSLTSATRTFTLTLQCTKTEEVEPGQCVQCLTVHTSSFTVTAAVPFHVEVSCESLQTPAQPQQQQGAAPCVRVNQPFLVTARVACSSHVPVTLHSSKLMLSSGVESCSGGGGNSCCGCIAACNLGARETASDCFCVQVTACSTPQLQLGHFLLHWSRRGPGDAGGGGNNAPRPVTMTVALPTVNVWSESVLVEGSAPAHCFLHCPAPLRYCVTNHSLHSLECVITIEQSQCFMLTGNQQIRVRLLSQQEQQLQYLLYPVACGTLPLPRVSVTVEAKPSSTRVMTQPVTVVYSRTLPSHLLVKPQELPLLPSVHVSLPATQTV